MKVHVKDKRISNHSYYEDECYILNISIKNNTECSGWTLRSTKHSFNGKTIYELNNKLDDLRKLYRLEKHNEFSSDYLIIFIDDLTKIRGFMYNQLNKDTDNDMFIDINCIEFRSYKKWTKDKNLDVVLETMTDWYKTFIADKYFYFTPNQLNRKRINKLLKDKYKDNYPDTIQYAQVMKAVHGGVLYYDKIPHKNNMLGLDITSAYIYSLVFCKHPVSKPENVDANDWASYIGKEDVGSIGIYEIEYNHPVNNISCYKDLDEQPLKSGHHKVKIALTNIDLKLLFDMKYIQIISCKCLYLLHYELDYLPKVFRDYCVDSFINKCSKTKRTIPYENAKVQLNGIFGNLILTNVKKAYDAEYKESGSIAKATQAADKAFDKLDKSTRPEWGVFTMAYCKQLVYTLSLQVAGWRYSDTDSIYCDDDSANRRIIEQFNNKIMSANYALCEQLGYMDYDLDKVCKLGTFDVESKIEKFRVWGNKTYAYKTVPEPTLNELGETVMKSKYVIKAAGCNTEELPADDSIFEDDYKPKVGSRTYTAYDENGYYETNDHGTLALLRGLIRV